MKSTLWDTNDDNQQNCFDPSACIHRLWRVRKIMLEFFNHLFRPLDDYRNMTAFEANQRTTTDLMALAPFVSRYQDEVITPMLTYVYHLLEKNGDLPEMPEILLEDPEFEIEYVGKLSLATKNFEVMGAFQTLQMFADVSQYIPQAREAFMNDD